jgi:hypothetical protein
MPAMLLLATARCGNLTELAGAGVETTNGCVVGLLVQENGVPDSNVLVMLFPAEYDPLTTANPVPFATADEAGRFEFNRIKTGTYTVVAAHAVLGTKAATYKIQVAADTVRLATDTMRLPGSIKIKIPERFDMVNGNFYIPGTGLIVSLNKASGGSVIIDSVPAGKIPGIYYIVKSSSAAPQVLIDGVIVPSGGTITIAFPEWAFSRRITLNTTSSGAGISSAIIDFPVLIRIDQTNFNFSEAKADGSDLRFAKSDGSPIPFEIERWNGVAQAAEVWVKVDTVRGNDSSQAIIMYWGNPAATSESSGPAVFDSSSGFEGVWHLSETSGTLARDASHNGFTGTYKGGLPRGEPGPLGISQDIARMDTDYVNIGNVLNPGMKNFAFGVWLKRSTLGTQQAFIAKTNGNAPSAAYGYLFNFDSDNLPHLYMATGSGSWGGDSTFDVKTDLAITDSTTWHYVFIVIDRSDNALCKMYLDGIDRTGHIGGNITHISAVSNALNLHIGTESDDNCSFSGSIGEVTVAFTVRSADWVKLSYMNQKEQDALVKW